MPSPVNGAPAALPPGAAVSLCMCWPAISEELSDFFTVHELLELTAAQQAWKHRILHTVRQSSRTDTANETSPVSVLVWLLTSLRSSSSVKLSCVLSSLLLVASIGQGDSASVQTRRRSLLTPSIAVEVTPSPSALARSQSSQQSPTKIPSLLKPLSPVSAQSSLSPQTPAGHHVRRMSTQLSNRLQPPSPLTDGHSAVSHGISASSKSQLSRCLSTNRSLLAHDSLDTYAIVLVRAVEHFLTVGSPASDKESLSVNECVWLIRSLLSLIFLSLTAAPTIDISTIMVPLPPSLSKDSAQPRTVSLLTLLVHLSSHSLTHILPVMDDSVSQAAVAVPESMNDSVWFTESVPVAEWQQSLIDECCLKPGGLLWQQWQGRVAHSSPAPLVSASLHTSFALPIKKIFAVLRRQLHSSTGAQCKDPHCLYLSNRQSASSAILSEPTVTTSLLSSVVRRLYDFVAPSSSHSSRVSDHSSIRADEFKQAMQSELLCGQTATNDTHTASFVHSLDSQSYRRSLFASLAQLLETLVSSPTVDVRVVAGKANVLLVTIKLLNVFYFSHLSGNGSSKLLPLTKYSTHYFNVFRSATFIHTPQLLADILAGLHPSQQPSPPSQSLSPLSEQSAQSPRSPRSANNGISGKRSRIPVRHGSDVTYNGVSSQAMRTDLHCLHSIVSLLAVIQSLMATHSDYASKLRSLQIERILLPALQLPELLKEHLTQELNASGSDSDSRTPTVPKKYRGSVIDPQYPLQSRAYRAIHTTHTVASTILRHVYCAESSEVEQPSSTMLPPPPIPLTPAQILVHLINIAQAQSKTAGPLNGKPPIKQAWIVSSGDEEKVESSRGVEPHPIYSAASLHGEYQKWLQSQRLIR